MTRITFDHVSKSYDRVQPLSDVSFTIEPGEFFVLVGPSGCGKSTLLRMIAGLETVTSGSLLFDGVSMNEVEARKRDVGMVFQNYALYPHLTVAENLAFPLSIRKVPATEIRTRVNDVAETLGLAELLDRKPKQLSGGQRQRVAVGRAIIRTPKVFLFDEPLSNLDAQLRTHMRTELRALQRRLGVTTVYVTHDQVEAMTMSDRMAILHDGGLQQVGTPADVYEHPATPFVATFTGSPSMNLLPYQGRTLGIRPERLTATPQADALPLDVVVTAKEFIGHEWLVHATMGSTSVIMRCTTDPDVALGSNVTWFAPQSAICWFPVQQS
ncbi:MAG: ATP-binding cassette domain-containing protein [Candidatus Kapabacteria bacterium]|nr:ATP-binding cassette domain-containing protein [Candidatus Kapabacteria bacterium]